MGHWVGNKLSSPLSSVSYCDVVELNAIMSPGLLIMNRSIWKRKFEWTL